MRPSSKFFVVALAASLLLAACGSSSNSSSSSQPANSQHTASSSKDVVRTASNAKLGKTVLVTAHGLTLYHLGGEQNGKFICTNAACVHAWRPLIAPGGAPSGSVSSLSIVKRPGGAIQVTYQGMPLYTFAQDTAPGQANGQGIKDVGTWSVASTSGHAPVSPAIPAPASSSSSRSSGY